MKKVKVKQVDYVGLALLSYKKALFVREIDKDGFPLSSFHFPGGSFLKEKNLSSILNNILASKYDGKVKIESFLSPVYSVSKDKITSLIIALGKEIVPLRFNKNIEGRYFLLEEAKENNVDPLDLKAFEKALIYSNERKEKISSDEYRELLSLKKAIRFYSSKIDKKEIKEILNFIDKSNNLNACLKAFMFMLKENNLSSKDYFSYLKKKNNENVF
ncbi:MAG TPA: hypothetical protein DD377_00930 [Firmicutes bacterium]|nr:hypothetical protein [Bacillota bacterium]